MHKRQSIPWIACGALALLAAVAFSQRESVSTPGVEAVTAGHPEPPTQLRETAVRGVNYAHIHRGGRGYGSETSREELKNLSGLGVDWIALTPFGYQQSIDEDQIAGFDPDTPVEQFLNPPPPGASGEEAGETYEGRRGRDQSMTDRHLAEQVAAAHDMGVKVMLKPHIWSRDFWRNEQWHGTVDQTTPETHERWRRSYLRFMLHYAALARDTQADALCLGTELIQQTTKYPEDWRTLIEEARKIYPGKLTYAAHWQTEYKTIDFWDELDAIGVSAYFPLDVPDDASVDQLVAAWSPYKQQLADVHARFGKPVVFLELGYRPATGAYREPWVASGGLPDPMIQSRAYEAVFRAFADEPWWHGLFIWKAFTDSERNEESRDGMGFSFRHQPAEQVVRQWFKGG
ncbi:MAG: hypothetical protein R3C45_09250 [Phycisphaerales bacterium]